MSLNSLKKYNYVLSSKSPRRKFLLTLLGLNFESFSPDVDENHENGNPVQLAKKLAVKKAEVADKIFKNKIIISADTIVVLNDKIYGKPKTKKEARMMLQNLSGKTHIVYTALCIINQKTNEKLVGIEKTFVTFRNLTKKEIDEYVKKGSCMDKAGAYGIQDDLGAVFVSKIKGCYYNVVGLPIQKLYLMLLEITKSK